MVDVYWNLHRDCFSVKVQGRPVAHVNRIALRDARFVVQLGGWKRTVREHRKRVHAMIRGEIVEFGMGGEGKSRHARKDRGTISITYNPYVAPYFRDRKGERIDTARIVWCWVRDGKPIVEALE
jgi:hypothetical protein